MGECRVFSQKALKYWLMALLVPVFAWAFLNKIWVGRFFLGSDNTDFFYLLIYHFKNIIHGVYPLWNPYKSWGCLDYLYTQDIGASNPFCMIIPILLILGVKAYWAYAAYIVTFWMVGLLGFFFLLNRIYNSPRIAWAGTSLLMFTAGLAVFFSWDILGLYIFMPLGWFFGFLVGFVKSSDDPALKRNLFGLCFSSMFIAHLYLPFYFLTIFLTFIVSVILFARGWAIGFWGAAQRSLRRIPWAVIFCLVSFLFSLWPTVDCYLKMKDPQNISEFYRGDNETKVGNAIVVSQQMIDIGGLPSRASFSELFSSFEMGDEYLSFVPLILFILVLLTLINRSSKVQRVIFLTAFLLLLIALTNVCPVQHFLYQHVYLFRLFRNYFFFWILFWSCGVVYVMGELKEFLKWEPVSPRQKVLYAGWVIIVHGGAAGYLMTLEDVPMVSYVTVIASCLLFLARIFKTFRLRQGLFIIALVFIGLWQPFYVLPWVRGVDHGQLDYVSDQGVFAYERPAFGNSNNEKNPSLHREKYFQDESGFGEVGYIGQKGSDLLGQNIDRATLSGYVRYKFILYDQTKLVQESSIDWEAVRRLVTFQDHAALIEDASGVISSGGKEPLPALVIKGPSCDLKVIHFDVNSVDLSIHSDRRKFLVYNDSFHSGWHVLVDQHPVRLYRANIAFKGVWVGAGDHRVRFYFGSWVDVFRGWGVSILFMFWLYLVIAGFLPCPRKYHEKSNI